ncbi:hypothetical protein FQA39_LY10108 [Lamprigera yunnana]|nr:hypothetical protein FQA39_LY10108 [Lamprigera yunnana]
MSSCSGESKTYCEQMQIKEMDEVRKQNEVKRFYLFSLNVYNLKDLLNCSICLDLYNCPVELSICKHIFCKNCLDTYFECTDKKEVVCPICHKAIVTQTICDHVFFGKVALFIKSALQQIYSLLGPDCKKYPSYTRIYEVWDNKNNFLKHILPIENMLNLSTVPDYYTIVQTKKNIAHANEKYSSSTKEKVDAFDVLVKEPVQNPFFKKSAVTESPNTYKKKCGNKEPLPMTIQKFENVKNKENAIQWLEGISNKFDVTQVSQQQMQMEIPDLEMSSASQSYIIESDVLKELDKKLNNKHTIPHIVQNNYKKKVIQRSRSLENSNKPLIPDTNLKRHSLGSYNVQGEFFIEQVSSEDDCIPPNKSKKGISINFMKNKCVSAIDKVVLSKKDINVDVQNENTSVPSIKKSGSSKGWKRMRDIDKEVERKACKVNRLDKKPQKPTACRRSKRVEKKSNLQSTLFDNEAVSIERSKNQQTIIPMKLETDMQQHTHVNNVLSNILTQFKKSDIQFKKEGEKLGHEDQCNKNKNDSFKAMVKTETATKENLINNPIEILETGETIREPSYRIARFGEVTENQINEHPSLQVIGSIANENIIKDSLQPIEIVQTFRKNTKINDTSQTIGITESVGQKSVIEDPLQILKIPLLVTEKNVKNDVLQGLEIIQTDSAQRVINETSSLFTRTKLNLMETESCRQEDENVESSSQMNKIKEIENIGIQTDKMHTVENIAIQTDRMYTVENIGIQTDTMYTVENIGIQTDQIFTVKNVGIQTDDAYKIDNWVQTVYCESSSSSRIPSINIYNRLHVTDNAAQTDAFVCSKCNVTHSKMNEMKKDGSEYTVTTSNKLLLSSSFDDINFETQDVIKRQQISVINNAQPLATTNIVNNNIEADKDHVSLAALHTSVAIKRVRESNSDCESEQNFSKCLKKNKYMHDVSVHFLSEDHILVNEDIDNLNSEKTGYDEPTKNKTSKREGNSNTDGNLSKHLRSEDMIREFEVLIKEACSETLRIERTQCEEDVLKEDSLEACLNGFVQEFNSKQNVKDIHPSEEDAEVIAVTNSMLEVVPQNACTENNKMHNNPNITPTCEEELFGSDQDVIETTPQKNRPSTIIALSQLFNADDNIMSSPVAHLNTLFLPPSEFQDDLISIKHAEEENRSSVPLSTFELFENDRKMEGVQVGEHFITSTPFQTVSRVVSHESLSLSPIATSSRQVNPVLAIQNAKKLPLSFFPAKIETHDKTSVLNTSTLKRNSILNYVKPDNNINSSFNKSYSLQTTWSTKKKPVISSSRLSTEESSALKLLSNKEIVSFENTFSSSVTHLIVGVDSSNCLKAPTIKYITAVAAGIWVLSIKWVQACLKRNRLVPEESFEVLDSSGVCGPQRSRLHRCMSPLFSNYLIYVTHKIKSISRKEVEKIILLLGGQVVPTPNHLLNTDNQICLIISENSDPDAENLYKIWLKTLRVVTVDLDWLAHSVGQYEVLSLTCYSMCGEESIGQLSYPDHLLKVASQVLSTADPVEYKNCSLLLENLGSAISSFSNCTIQNARPILFCENCVDEYIDIIQGYKNMSLSKDEDGICIDHYIHLDNLEIVQTLYDNSVDLWTRAKCYGEYVMNVFYSKRG